MLHGASAYGSTQVDTRKLITRKLIQVLRLACLALSFLAGGNAHYRRCKPEVPVDRVWFSVLCNRH